MSFRKLTTLKKKDKSKKSTSSVPYAHDPDLAYDRTRNNLIEGLKVAKAVGEASSLLAPMKAVCELGILFLETTKAVDENTSSLKQLQQRVSSHIEILQDGLKSLPSGTRGPAAITEFRHAQQEYIAGLNAIRDRLNDMLLRRGSGSVRSILGKIGDARIDPGIIASIKEDIFHQSRIFAEATKRPMIDLQEEVWKMASLGPEQARPMGTQHKLCLPGTRLSVLGEIRDWATSDDSEKPVFWLCDIGGTGKSTVAFTLCHEWDATDQLIITRFFFSKNARSTSETDIVCTTLGKDLGAKDDTIRKYVKEAFEQDEQLGTRPLAYQFSKLVEASIQLTAKRVIFVIDAIDECRADMRRDLLALIVKRLPTLPNLRILLTSRPEPDIMTLLQGMAIVRSMQYELQGRDNQANVEDIRIYVENHFTGLLTRSERQQLVDKANGLFIWVATARLELEQVDGPDARVRTLTSLISRGEGGDINHLYARILRRLSQETSLDKVKKIIGTISILLEPVSIRVLSKLISIDPDDLEPIISSMRSVLRAENVVEFLHPTFHEYLHSSRNEELRVDAGVYHSDVARTALEVLQADLRQDVCNISIPDHRYPDNNDVSDLEGRLNALWTHSPALLYSARYWSAHVIAGISREEVMVHLGSFLRNSMLYFIELLSLIGKLVWIKNFEDVRRCLRTYTAYQEERELCREILCVVSTNRPFIERSALHIYSSSLYLLPRKSKLYARYHERFKHALPKVLYDQEVTIPSYLELVEQDTRISCGVFSPDGTCVVSGSENGSIRLWDSVAGAAIGVPLRCGKFSVQTVCFSSDGTMVASCSDYEARSGSIMHIWDAFRGVQVGQPMIAADLTTLKISFTTECDRLLAAGYKPDNLVDNHEINLWSTTGCHLSCATVGSFDVDLNRYMDYYKASLVSVTANTKRVVYGLQSDRIAIFDVVTEKRLQDLVVFSPGEESIRGVASSANGDLIAATHYNRSQSEFVVSVWMAATGDCILHFTMRSPFHIAFLTFTANDTKIIHMIGGEYVVLDIATAQLVWGNLRHYRMQNLDVSQTDFRALARSFSGTSLLWDCDPNGEQDVSQTGLGSIQCMCISDSKLWFATCTYPGELQVWDAFDGRRIGRPMPGNTLVTFMDISPDDAQIAAGSCFGDIKIWDRITATMIGEVNVSVTPGLWGLRFSLDGETIVARSIPDHSSREMLLYELTRRSGTWVAKAAGVMREDTSEDNIWITVTTERPIMDHTRSTLVYKDGYISDSRRPRLHFGLSSGIEILQWLSYDDKIALRCDDGWSRWLDFTNIVMSP
ncbi:SubName: Full=Uncharacterized protein {ECO:0000313/EMBL:CCA73458.1} [Serendipita indica DSM 11827]|uniref:Nephrocystin 3-like N-terminal domain-containing protein n=1 Tax=Serendipita indica (strain DSM 11827) TaxID=1109443 RepID=G4TQ65_SERID|nr:SubName: Full=Uncharacterized protein {ECO:0000313/EMBL:CCA73458.1} [Serendipita indica DSM 11827]CCA73458.1 hypothetical protein PIIN_07412 [Serendipita indica DSM 11827]